MSAVGPFVFAGSTASPVQAQTPEPSWVDHDALPREPDLSEGGYAISELSDGQIGRIVVELETRSSRDDTFEFIVEKDGGEVGAFRLADAPDASVEREREIEVPAGIYTVTESNQPHWTIEAIRCDDPSGGTTVDRTRRRASVELQAGEVVECTFLNDRPSRDYGDAPDGKKRRRYPTYKSHDGAAHLVVPGFHLGQRVDVEGDGRPTPGADGDDDTRTSDEDGVTFESRPLVPGEQTSVEVVASEAGHLDAWIDFDGDETWQSHEAIIEKAKVGSGANDISFEVPNGAVSGATYARFRFSRYGGLAPTGRGGRGEVEDYRVEIAAGAASSTGAGCVGGHGSDGACDGGRPVEYRVTATPTDGDGADARLQFINPDSARPLEFVACPSLDIGVPNGLEPDIPAADAVEHEVWTIRREIDRDDGRPTRSRWRCEPGAATADIPDAVERAPSYHFGCRKFSLPAGGASEPVRLSAEFESGPADGGAEASLGLISVNFLELGSVTVESGGDTYRVPAEFDRESSGCDEIAHEANVLVSAESVDTDLGERPSSVRVRNVYFALEDGRADVGMGDDQPDGEATAAGARAVAHWRPGPPVGVGGPTELEVELRADLEGFPRGTEVVFTPPAGSGLGSETGSRTATGPNERRVVVGAEAQAGRDDSCGGADVSFRVPYRMSAAGSARPTLRVDLPEGPCAEAATGLVGTVSGDVVSRGESNPGFDAGDVMYAVQAPFWVDRDPPALREATLSLSKSGVLTVSADVVDSTAHAAGVKLRYWQGDGPVDDVSEVSLVLGEPPESREGTHFRAKTDNVAPEQPVRARLILRDAAGNRCRTRPIPLRPGGELTLKSCPGQRSWPDRDGADRRRGCGCRAAGSGEPLSVVLFALVVGVVGRRGPRESRL